MCWVCIFHMLLFLTVTPPITIVSTGSRGPSCRAVCSVSWTYSRAIFCPGMYSEPAAFDIFQYMGLNSIPRNGIYSLQNPKRPIRCSLSSLQWELKDVIVGVSVQMSCLRMLLTSRPLNSLLHERSLNLRRFYLPPFEGYMS